MNRHKQIYERAVNRAVMIFNESYLFQCSNGSMEFYAYKSRPTFLEDSDLGRRVVSGYEFLITATTFNKLSTLAGSNGLFESSSCIKDGEGNSYILDRLTPFQSLAMEAGYKLLVKKVKGE